MRRHLIIAVVWAGVLVPAAPGMAQDDDGPRLRWNDEWGRFGTAELAATSFLAVGGVGLQMYFVPEIGRQAGGVLIDDAVRDLLHRRDRSERGVAARISDVLVNANMVWPYLIDTLVVAWAVDSSRDVAGQMFWINALSYMTTTTAVTLTKNAVARERPFHDECLRDIEYDQSCARSDRFRSFFSGHAAYAFTGASLMCIHHANLPLYDAAWADAAACIGSMAFAAGTALMRIMADKHYFSDVIVGAAVGVLSGLVMPALLHYGWDWNRSEGAAR